MISLRVLPFEFAAAYAELFETITERSLGERESTTSAPH